MPFSFCSPCEDNWGDLMAIARAFAFRESSRVAAALDGLGDLVTTLAGVPGRKAIVHVSSGLPQRPGESVFSYLVDQVCPAINSAIMRNHNDARGAIMSSNRASRFNLVSAHANANRVTIFSLDAAGIRAASGADISTLGGRTALGGRRQPSPSNHALYTDNAQQGLFLLADETGGKTLFNSNDAVDLLDDVAEEVSNTYSVGFLLSDRRPEQVRQVEVRLVRGKGKGRRVRYRRSFRDKTLEERLAERLLSFAYLGGEENLLRADVGFAPSSQLRRTMHGLIVEVAVPADAVTLLPDPDSGEGKGRLRLWLLAVDEDKGTRTTVRQTGARVGAGGVPSIAGAYRFEVDVTIPEGTYTVARRCFAMRRPGSCRWFGKTWPCPWRRRSELFRPGLSLRSCMRQEAQPRVDSVRPSRFADHDAAPAHSAPLGVGLVPARCRRTGAGWPTAIDGRRDRDRPRSRSDRHQPRGTRGSACGTAVAEQAASARPAARVPGSQPRSRGGRRPGTPPRCYERGRRRVAAGTGA